MQRAVPFNKPFIAGKELFYVAQAVTLGNISGDGHFTQRCSRLLEERFGIQRVLLTPSCTAALEMAVLLAGVAPGDEVILPSFTFVSTANAVMRAGATPVFVDIRQDTLNLDEAACEAAVTERTRAIIPVHYAGVACAMDRVLEIARQHGLEVIEDAAQGVNAFHNEQALGAIAPLGAYSFHETKNYTCGEGGALCVNAEKYVERAEILRDKGTNRSKFLRGEVDKYTWVDVGSSYVPSEIVSAFLFGQLEMLEPIAARRREIDAGYRERLAPLEAAGHLALPVVPEGCQSNHHMFYVLLPDAATRDALLDYLRGRGIGASFHYVPLHTSPMGEQLGWREGSLPITEAMSGRLARLPFYYEINSDDQDYVAETMSSFFRESAARRPAKQPLST